MNESRRFGIVPSTVVLLASALAACSAAGGDDGAGVPDGRDSGSVRDGSSGDSGAADVGFPDAGADGGPAANLAANVSKDSYLHDLTAIAVLRPPGSPGWQAAQDLCASRFESLGFAVERHAYGTGVNVIGVKPGASADEIIISAHYDHVADCEGADDNASGTAGVLEAARVLSGAVFDRTLVVACWDEEEAGLLGSKAYAARALERGGQIAVSIVLEMIGFKNDVEGSQEMPTGLDLVFPDQAAWLKRHKFKADFIAFVADDFAHETAAALVRHSDEIGLPSILLELSQDLKESSMTHTLKRSDHSPFWKNDVPAIMVTDTSEYRNPNYHCAAGPDSVATLDHDFAAAVIKAAVAAAAETLRVAGSE
ncbi:MAG: M20/M25/M40 family metallo-hydrolase [Deltaproteobacteria bacterium]|nr:M20/M25/M40 family metallo-hydrolase [Deltaproteobacteria bacterium]